MASPRKFSDKIALLTQKQIEGTAAFDAILREVSATTRVTLFSFSSYVTYVISYYAIGKLLETKRRLRSSP